ncbi:hypothetical protein HDV04_001194 [Boothiomyces sp. JEL0838]|nr:hypothetical protein HDV04_001194 [Boothiomyces sp. JEL0838]
MKRKPVSSFELVKIPSDSQDMVGFEESFESECSGESNSYVEECDSESVEDFAPTKKDPLVTGVNASPPMVENHLFPGSNLSNSAIDIFKNFSSSSSTSMEYKLKLNHGKAFTQLEAAYNPENNSSEQKLDDHIRQDHSCHSYIEKEHSSKRLRTDEVTFTKHEVYSKREAKKVAQYFLEWKIDLRWYFNDPISLLTQTFKLNLSNLESGNYQLGAAHDCELKVYGSPSCPKHIGTIISEGKRNNKYLQLTKDFPGYEEPILLQPGWFHDLDDFVKLEVYDDNHFRIYDLASAAYTTVLSGPSDLFYRYNPNIVFFGKPISNFHLEVSFYGTDITFEMDYDAKRHRAVVYYTDDVSNEQRIYPARAVDLIIVSETQYIMNFNFSYPTNIYKGDQLEVNCIDIPMYGGANPIYF